MKSRVGRSTAGALFVLGLAGCGGDSPTAPSTATPTAPPAPVASVLMQGSLSNMDPRVLFTVGTFNTTAAGKLDVTVDWTFATNDVDVYVARGTCSLEQVNNRTCPFVTLSESTTAKPEKLTVSSLDPGTYSLMIGNLGPTAESASYQVVHTR
jgi:hypothetical protein